MAKVHISPDRMEKLERDFEKVKREDIGIGIREEFERLLEELKKIYLEAIHPHMSRHSKFGSNRHNLRNDSLEDYPYFPPLLSIPPIPSPSKLWSVRARRKKIFISTSTVSIITKI
jgi:hypothetical protein